MILDVASPAVNSLDGNINFVLVGILGALVVAGCILMTIKLVNKKK